MKTWNVIEQPGYNSSRVISYYSQETKYFQQTKDKRKYFEKLCKKHTFSIVCTNGNIACALQSSLPYILIEMKGRPNLITL